MAIKAVTTILVLVIAVNVHSIVMQLIQMARIGKSMAQQYAMAQVAIRETQL
jgi:hypothetical protein